MYRTAVPVMQWCETHASMLTDRTPVATVGLVWSQQNTDFFGRDDPGPLVDQPYTGFMHALVRARIPYVPIHIDDVAETQGIQVLILPNIGAMSDTQAAAIRNFVARGGSLVATSRSSLYDEWGDPRTDFALADLFRAHWNGDVPRLGRARTSASGGQATAAFAPSPSGHTYLRLSPEWRARVDGPHIAGEPAATGSRHRVLDGFDETDILAYGGLLVPVRVEAGATVPLTYVPPFPTYPPETAWMREPKTDVPGLVLSTHGTARVAFMPADIDRRYALEHLPDHARLLANVIRWAASDTLPLTVEGPGLIDCHLFEQPGRLILHLVNLTSEATWRAPLDELIRVGPFQVRAAWSRSRGGAPRRARLLVSGSTRPVRVEQSMAVFTIESILDHEVIVLE